jgi:trk system potassium uptake protein TrkA
MRIIIVGCGRMGAALAKALGLQDHDVTVVDTDPTTFERLDQTLHCRTVVGVGFDRDVLTKAGIQRADGLAAVTPSDETNVVAARLASQVFRVPRVVARLYDPRKAEIYHRLGLQTIAPVTWAVNRIADLLCYSQLDPVVSLGTDVDVVELDLPPQLSGRTVKDLTIPGELQVVAISRGGKTFMPSLGTAFQPGDLVHLALLASSADRVRAMLGLG